MTIPIIRLEKKLSSVEDRGQTDRVSAPTRAGIRLGRTAHVATLSHVEGHVTDRKFETF